MLKESFITIHNAIHNKNQKSVWISGIEYPIKFLNDTNCRYIEYWDSGKKYVFIEQNPKQRSEYAQRARNGEKITWGVPASGGRWIQIDNVTLANFSRNSVQKQVA